MVTLENIARPVLDPLLQSVSLPLCETFFPVGFPVEIATNDARVLEAARGGYSAYRARFEERPMRIHVAVAPNGTTLPPDPVFRAQRHLFSITCDADNFAMCDLEQGFAYAWIGSAVAAHRGWLRYRFLETMIFLTLCHRHLTPIHAACISRNGKALLLAAPSGTGKTTLSYACARCGWAFLSDDATYLLRGRRDRTVLGKPYLIRFVDSAARLFPAELGGLEAFPDVHGEMRVELQPGVETGLTTEERGAFHRLVFLERRANGGARLIPIGREEGMRRILAELQYYGEDVWEQHRDSALTLLEPDPVLLVYGDYSEAVPLLESLVS